MRVADGLRVNDGRIDVDVFGRHHARQHSRNRNVENRADDQRRDDTNGDIPRRLFRFFRVNRDRIETNVGEEDDRGSRKHPQRFSALRRLTE